MFTLTYDAPTVRGMERYATRAEAEAEAEAVRTAMLAVGYGAHTDSIVIREDRELTADEAQLEAEAARLTLEAAEDEAAGAYAGSDEWYAVGVADDALRDAEHELSRARAREARAERALSAAHHDARVAEAEARVTAAQRAAEAAADAASGTHFGSDEWYAVYAADDALRDAERALSTARLARARAERAADDAAADARYTDEAEAGRRAYAYRAPIYGRGN